MGDSLGTSGIDTPATDGTAYGATTAPAANENGIILPAGTQTGSYIITAPQGNGGTVYLGWDSDVDNNTGLPLLPGRSISVDLDNSRQEIYGYFTNGTDELRYLATN